MKSLVSLIDETIAEVEELKKSDRFSASEVKLEGPGSGIAGKDSNGSMGKEEDEKKEKDEDEDEDDMDKGEGKNSEADPNAGHHKVEKDETGMPAKTSAEKAEGQAEKAEGQNRQADPNGGKHKSDSMDKKEDKEEDEKKEDKKKDKKEDMDEKMMKKSAEEAETLLKSYVDQRLSPIESKLESIMTLVKEIADSPVPSKGQTYRSFDALKKSDETSESTLSKAAIVEKLFELKKSGARVDSIDIASAELAKGSELVKIAQKYNIK